MSNSKSFPDGSPEALLELELERLRSAMSASSFILKERRDIIAVSMALACLERDVKISILHIVAYLERKQRNDK